VILLPQAVDLAADFEVAPEFELGLFAETPQLYNPSAIAVDPRADRRWLWVAEAVDYRRWDGRNPGFARAGGDRVVVLEDGDGDGHCERARVFVQDPDLVAPLGIAVLGERVFVSCSPSIFVYTDADGDGTADRRETFLTGFGGHDHDHGVHSIVAGPPGSDGEPERLYLAVGNAGPHVVTDRSGWTLRAGSVYVDGGAAPADNKPGLVSDDGRVYTGGLILSVRPDGTDLRVEAHDFRNPYEVALDGHGNLYTFDNDDEVAACRASWILPGSSFGFFSADGARTWRADQRPGQSIATAHWHADDPGVLTSGVITGSGGPTGVCVYPGAVGDWNGMLLACDAGRGAVLAFRPRPAGADVRLDERAALLAARAGRDTESARWFRPSDVAAAPDGVLYVADWYDPGVGGHAMGDARAYGRILRLAPRHGVGPADIGPEEASLRSRLVRPLLVRSGRLAAGADAGEAPEVQRELLLSLRGVPLERALPQLLAHARVLDPRDRVWLEAFGLACAGREPEVYDALELEAGADPGAWDERMAALSWRLHPPGAVPALLERALDPALAPAARKQAMDALAFVRTRAAADALANLAVASPEDLRSYARWWLADRATNDWRGWVDEAALGGRLADAELVWTSGLVRTGARALDVDVRGAERLWLVVDEGEHGNGYDWADWLEPRFEGAGGTRRLIELDWLAETSGWGATRRGRSCEGGPLVVEGATHADGIGTHARSEIAWAVPAGAERFRAVAAPDDMGSKRAGSTNELEFQVWVERKPARDRLAPLVAALASDDGAAAREAALALALDPEGALVLLREAERGTLDGALRAAVGERIFDNPDLGVRARASAFFHRSGEEALPSAAELLALRGDAAAGRELFFSERAQCGRCHALERGGRRRGGAIGPELTGVRTKLDAPALLDAILNPSATIAHGFESWRVETRDGELLAGFLVADGPTLVLQDTQGKRRAIAADEVATRERETLSVMPSGLAAGLAPQELSDLVAALREDPEREPVFGPEQALFDGRSLAGWRFHLADPRAEPGDVWSIEEGTIVCRGEPAGYLCTEARFTSFELELDWRFDPGRGPGNSGVLLRRTGPDKVWPRSIEAQLLARQAGDIWNIDEVPMLVDPERTSGRHTERARPCSEKPLGEWNHYRIRLDRERLTLEVNGVVQNTASFCQELAGEICLQSEGAWIQFRDVRLRPILN